MGAVKNTWMDIAREIQRMTGNPYDECMDIARPLANLAVRNGSCQLPDGSTFFLIKPPWNKTRNRVFQSVNHDNRAVRY